MNDPSADVRNTISNVSLRVVIKIETGGLKEDGRDSFTHHSLDTV